MLHYVLHPGHATVAAGLAVGEELGVGGRELLAAIVLGYEVGDRIAIAIQPTAERGAQVWGEGYHSFPAAVTAGKLLGGFVEEELDVALGIAGIYSCVPSVYKYFGPVSETRPIREVKQGGRTLAASSQRCPSGAALRVVTASSTASTATGRWSAPTVAATPTAWSTVSAKPGRRRRPSTRFIRRSGSLTRRSGRRRASSRSTAFGASDVDEVVVTTLWAELLGDSAPGSAVDAQFSLPYTVAATILGEPLGPELYTEEKLADPALLELLGRIRLVHDPAADRAFFEGQRIVQSVEITLRDGRNVRREIEFPRDRPAYGKPELEAKFEALASGVLDEAKRARLRDALDGLAELDDVRRLTELLS